jgi:hypothetical protein
LKQLGALRTCTDAEHRRTHQAAGILGRRAVRTGRRRADGARTRSRTRSRFALADQVGSALEQGHTRREEEQRAHAVLHAVADGHVVGHTQTHTQTQTQAQTDRVAVNVLACILAGGRTNTGPGSPRPRQHQRGRPLHGGGGVRAQQGKEQGEHTNHAAAHDRQRRTCLLDFSTDATPVGLAASERTPGRR